MNTLAAIEVMQAYLSGKKIECRVAWPPGAWDTAANPTWNWKQFEYRVKSETKKYRVALYPTHVVGEYRPCAVPENEWQYNTYPWISEVLEYVV